MIIENTNAQPLVAKRKKGFTLTEIAIVLGIMGLILGAIWVAAAGVFNNQRVNQGQTAVLQILQATRTLYAQQATMADVDQSANLINAGVIPTNLISGLTLKAPWGGNMFVTGTTDTNGIVIVMDQMSTALCVGLVSSIGGASHDRTLMQSSIVDATASPGITAATAVGLSTNSGLTVTGVTPPVTGGVPFANAPTAPTGTGCTASSNSNNAAFVFGLQG